MNVKNFIALQKYGLFPKLPPVGRQNWLFGFCRSFGIECRGKNQCANVGWLKIELKKVRWGK